MIVPNPLEMAISNRREIATFKLEIHATAIRRILINQTHLENKFNNPVESKITPLKGGIHVVKGLMDWKVLILAANVPAIKSGNTCPRPKLLSRTAPVNGFPL